MKIQVEFTPAQYLLFRQVWCHANVDSLRKHLNSLNIESINTVLGDALKSEYEFDKLVAETDMAWLRKEVGE